MDVNVKETETAITELPAEDLAELSTWFADYLNEVWDERIEHDLDAGRLDALLQEADAE